MQLRTETVIGLSAMLLSAVTAGAVLWQAKVSADQRAASVWPYVQVEGSRSTSAPFFRIILTNVGVGPAVVRHFAVRVDDQPVTSWSAFQSALFEDDAARTARIGEGVIRGSGWVLAPEDPRPVFSIQAPEAVNAVDPSQWGRIGIDVCYCSIFNTCWLTDGALLTREEPRRVRSCPTSGRFGVDGAAPAGASARPD